VHPDPGGAELLLFDGLEIFDLGALRGDDALRYLRCVRWLECVWGSV
jgi:hypothetical protein